MGNCNELWPVRPSPEIKPEKYPTPSWACPASTPSEKPRSNCLVGWKDWGGYDYDKQIGTAFKYTNAKLVPSINFDPNDGLNNLDKYWPLGKKMDGYIQYCNTYGSGQKPPLK